jgi:Protein of unknown function (DUF3631)/Domain of unknown function (DUF3854)
MSTEHNAYGMRLFDHHAEYLSARAVSPEVARERGYVSADQKTQLGRLGFGSTQRRVPGLVIPIHDVLGEVSGWQLRPDHPRQVDGRVVKFEAQRGSSLKLDVPPRTRPHLGNPEVPLYVTEGSVKADAAVSAGLPCVALHGVYGWKAKNEFGGTTVLAELEYLHLKHRRVFLTFDSDILLKPQVHDALSKFHGVLVHRGADVGVVILPPDGQGTKCGVDDYFARGGTVDDLVTRHVQKGLPRPPTIEVEADEEPPILDETMTLAGLLQATRDFVGRFIVFANDHQAVAVALWAAHAWMLDAFDLSPRLLVTGPTKRSAKTRLLDALALVVPRSRRCGSASGASMFRLIDKLHPTLLVDEADRIFRHRGGDPASDLVAQVIDQGFERGTPVLRVERTADGGQEVREFDAFAATGIAGIDKGAWPDTVLDRSVIVRMRRRRRGETVEKLRRRGQGVTDGETLRRTWAGYVASNPDLLARLSGAHPGMPEELHDRAADCWESLVAIADAAGGHWPAMAREAARALTPGEDEDDDLGVALLTDLRRVWPDGEEEVATKVLVGRCCEREDSPWTTYGRQGKGLTGKAMANILRPFGIHPCQIEGAGHHGARGYARAQFEDAWSRYCEDRPLGGRTVPGVPSLTPQGDSAPPKCPAESEPGTHIKGSDPLQDKGCATWDTSEREKSEEPHAAPPGVEVDPETGNWTF